MATKRTFIITVMITNILFIFIILHKQHAHTKLAGSIDRHKDELIALKKQVDALQHELNNLQNLSIIKAYAKKYLKMSPITPHQLRKIETC